MERKELIEKVDNWLKYKREDYIKDVIRLVRIRSIYSTPSEGKPYGNGCYEVLQEALKMSSDYGFNIRNYDNYAGSAIYGDNEKSIGIIGHLDVVPEGDGWSSDPFEPFIKDNKYIFGRGTADNKAPALVGLYAMRFLKDCGINLKHSIMMVYGCDEERGMSDIPEFLKRERAPVFSLVPDAKYPCGHAEKGIIEFELESGILEDNNFIHEISGGIAINSVPNYAYALLKSCDIDTVLQKIDTSQNITASLYDGKVKIEASGDLRHASRPHGAINAIEQLLNAILSLGIASGKTKSALEFLSSVAADYYGKTFSINCEDDLSGGLTSVGSIINSIDNKIKLSMNIRYPVTADYETILSNIQYTAKKSGFNIQGMINNKALYIPLDNPLITKLVDITSDLLNQEGLVPLVLDGGTYARKLPNAVSFGVTVPGRVRLFGMEKGGAHQVDEYGIIDHLLLGIKIYVVALYELDQLL